MKVLRHRAGILLVDLLRGDLHIDERSLDVRVPHQLHERGQAHTTTNHVRGKGMPKAVWIRELDVRSLTMVAK